jgi:transcription elongation GreA/GreB family factor
MMNKREILQAVLAELEEELRRQLAAQAAAAEGATHAESRAETKWDTCGLELSYLARGLAKQFETLAKQVEELRAFTAPDFAGKAIGIGALVETRVDGETNHFILLNCGGGTEVAVGGVDITAITPESPVGAALMGKKKGQTYSFRAGLECRIRDVR